jgi:hypothetical protein
MKWGIAVLKKKMKVSIAYIFHMAEAGRLLAILL